MIKILTSGSDAMFAIRLVALGMILLTALVVFFL